MLFGHSWQWFQCVSDVENLGGHEVLFEHFCLSFPSAAWEQAWFSRASPQKCAKFWPPHGLCLYGGRDSQAMAPRTHHLSTTPQLTPRAGDRHVFPLQQPPVSSYSLSSTQPPVTLQKDHSPFLILQQLPSSLRTKPRQLP